MTRAEKLAELSRLQARAGFDFAAREYKPAELDLDRAIEANRAWCEMRGIKAD